MNGNDFMASMLVYNYVTDISNVPKSTLPTYNSDLQFSISGENVSVGPGLGSSRFNVFGDATIDGNVGIYNDNPVNKLTVNTDGNYDGISIWNSSTNNIMAALRKNDDDSGYLNLYAGGSSKISFPAQSGGASYINNGGKFGIGTNTPSKTLDVSGNSVIGAGVNNITPAGVGDPSIQCSSIVLHNNSANNEIYIRPIGVAEYQFQTYNGKNAGEIQLQPYGGLVGIGTTSPSYPLDVNGEVSATSFNATSDIRLKENITNLDNSLDKICNIRGVNYNWKNDETKTKTSGIIAQEILEQIPEAVNKNDSEKLTVNYNSIIAHLIESVKELKIEIEKLKANK